ncbi:IS5 family transposase [Bailinhaonella thermotolerans]|uniref:IS5 family transposase n=1 Tax=Bailinhaonella thermotolerans TaxID=1070861 RepID=A0A3A4B1J2_9ACTN|nr:IS5 family transposase [Bailinhaonella thermotolerans]RJL31897.1 IS5 family transposase [Bailinhaonella thermotolerans]
MVRRHELSDAAWERIAPLLPPDPPRGGRWRDHRQVLNGIVWKIRTGADWRDVPERYGPWQTVYQRFRRWSADGTWDRLWEHVQAHGDAAGVVDWSAVCVDSTIVRAHQHAAGARKGGAGGANAGECGPGGQALGRSRGGLTTKVHLAVDGTGLPLAVLVTGGNINDCTQAIALLQTVRIPRAGRGRPRTRPQRVIADKAYSSAAIRGYLRRRHIAATIPERADQVANRARRGSGGGRPPAFDPAVYRRRNVIERCINRLKQFKGIATRYDKLAIHYRSALTIACLLLWLRRDP